MASSNRHWPSMFKSKPIYTNQKDHQWQTSNNLHSPATNRSSPYSSGCDERTPEPKPRWNPKPEQIRILESIFNSGLVNPPRDEIRRIRGRLQEYGQVGDANVFYWFQNRKSRSKHKNRQLQKTQNQHLHPEYPTTSKAVTITSSSSSSDKSSSKSIEFFLNSPTVSVNQQSQSYLGGAGGTRSHQHHEEFFQEPFFFPVVQQKIPTSTSNLGSFTQGLCFPEIGTMIDQQNQQRNDDNHPVVSNSNSGMLLTDLMMNHQYGIPTKNPKEVEEDNIINMLSHTTSPPPPPVSPTLILPPTTIVSSTINDHIQGVEEAAGGTGKPIVFINDVPFEVPVGPFNVKEAFGGDAILVDSSGQSVLTNEWGITLQSLEHGASYYLIRKVKEAL